MKKNLIRTILVFFLTINSTIALSANNNQQIRIEQTPISASNTVNQETVKSQPKIKCENAQHCVKVINKRITQYWILPARNSGLKTILIIDIGTQGYIAQIRINHSSGDRMYDDSVIRAVRKAAPFDEITSLTELEITEFESLKLIFKR